MRNYTLCILDRLSTDQRTISRLPRADAIYLRDASFYDIKSLDTHGIECIHAPSWREAQREAKEVANDLLDAFFATRIGEGLIGDIWQYAGIDIRKVTHTHIVTPFVEALTELLAFDLWWKNESPKRIYLPRSASSTILAARLVAEKYSIPIETFRQTPVHEPIWPLSRRTFTQWTPVSLRVWRDQIELRRRFNRLKRQFRKEYSYESCDVIALAHYGAEAKAFLPVIRKLIDQKQVTVSIGVEMEGQAWEVLKDIDLPRRLLQNTVSWRDVVPKIECARKRLTNRILETLEEAEVRRLEYRSFKIVDLLAPIIRSFVAENARHDTLTQILLWIEILNSALEKWQPRVVLVADEAMPFAAIAIRVARMHGIKTLHIQHGAMPDHPKHIRGEADIITVGGDAIKQYLVKRGTDPAKVIATGYPQFDPLVEIGAQHARSIREKFGFGNDTPLVVYTMLSGVGLTSRRDVIAATREVIEARRTLGSECMFLVKRHPADRGDLLSEIGVDLSALGIVSTIDDPIHPILAAADVVVTQMSTTGTEAVMLDKPLIILNLSRSDDSIPYVSYGAAIGVYSRGGLSNAINSALSDNEVSDTMKSGREAFIRDYAFAVDGKATDRIIDQITNLVQMTKRK